MRSKEEAHDYRYFPEPDLPPLVVEPAWVEAIRAALPELPDGAQGAVLAQVYGLSDYDADVLVRLTNAAPYFEALVRAGAPAKAASNLDAGRGAPEAQGRSAKTTWRAPPFPPMRWPSSSALTERGVVSSSAAKDVFEKMWATGRRAGAIVEEEGLAQIGDEAALAAIVAEVIDRHQDAVAQFRAGKQTTFGFLVGQVMKASGGKANPKLVSELLRKALER